MGEWEENESAAMSFDISSQPTLELEVGRAVTGIPTNPYYLSQTEPVPTALGRPLSQETVGTALLKVQQDLPNGSKVTKMMFKDAIHTPDMAFTLIAISKLNKARYKVVFHKSTCTIINLKGKTITTIPHSEGLYRISSAKSPENGGQAATASGKMSISEAHRKLGHISYGVITHAISKGFITGIEAFCVASEAEASYPDLV